MKNSIYTIFRKELSRFFGDKRMLITTVLMPGLMIFIFYNIMGTAISSQTTLSDDYSFTVNAVNMPDSVRALTDEADMIVSDIGENDILSAKDAVSQKLGCDVLVVFPENFDEDVASYDSSGGKTAPGIEIYYNTASVSSVQAFTALSALLDEYEAGMINKFDVNRGDGVFDLASKEDTSASVFSSMLPMLLLVFLYSGCLAVAPESIAGEKERGTIATLLITPVKRSHIALGKILALAVIALMSGASSAIGTILSLPKMIAGEGEIRSNVYGIHEYFPLALVVLSTVLVLIALISLVSAFAKSVKEAQTYVSPLMIIIVIVGVSGMFGSPKHELPYFFIPIYNSVQCMTSIFSFNADFAQTAVTVASNLAFTVLGVYLLTRMFNSEKVMFAK